MDTLIAPRDVIDHAKGTTSRYTCVNLQNKNTIEFRMFRGTLKYNTIIATIQFVDYLTDIAKELREDEIQELTWVKFVRGLLDRNVPELITYLKERQLFINDPIDCEEEV